MKSFVFVIFTWIAAVTGVSEGKGRSVSFQVRETSYTSRPVVFNNEILKFKTVTLNTGNAYNSKSGIFTTPVTGTYLFWANVMGFKNKPLVINLRKDGRRLARGHTSYDVQYGVATIVYLTKLKKGEHVWFGYEAPGGIKPEIHGHDFSFYGGTLVSL